jgi:hypothetical protein
MLRGTPGGSGSSAQPANDKLTAVAGVGASTGVILNTGATTAEVRALGVAAGTSIPTVTDVDTRFARVKTSDFSTDGTNGDYGYRPDLGLYQLRTAGTWADAAAPTATGAQLYDGTYPAASHTGRSRFVTTWGVWTVNEWFTSDGTSWFPSSRILHLFDDTTTNVAAGVAIEQVVKTDAIPANMLKGVKIVRARTDCLFVGATATKLNRLKFGATGAGLSGTTVVSHTTPVAGDLVQIAAVEMTFISDSSQTFLTTNELSSTGLSLGAASNATSAINVTSACDFIWTWTLNAADSGAVRNTSYICYWPSRKT